MIWIEVWFFFFFSKKWTWISICDFEWEIDVLMGNSLRSGIPHNCTATINQKVSGAKIVHKNNDREVNDIWKPYLALPIYIPTPSQRLFFPPPVSVNPFLYLFNMEIWNRKFRIFFKKGIQCKFCYQHLSLGCKDSNLPLSKKRKSDLFPMTRPNCPPLFCLNLILIYFLFCNCRRIWWKRTQPSATPLRSSTKMYLRCHIIFVHYNTYYLERKMA